MKRFWSANIDQHGRRARAWLGFGLLVVSVPVLIWRWWAGLPILAVALFVLFEAARSWCFLRACGIKTRH